jgi:catechol 2,3-dioxygenase-like lactoylglutathione lyase family enzyme
MLSSHTPVATLPTKDLAKARSFYEGTLGLTASREDIGGVAYACGSGQLFVYESAYAGTNQATSVTFDMSDPSEFDGEVGDLRAKGIDFLEFEGPYGVEWNDGVASMVGMGRGVWFTDLDGNILNLAAREH